MSLSDMLIGDALGVVTGVVVTRLWLWWPTRRRKLLPQSQTWIKVQTFTATNTYTPTFDMKKVVVKGYEDDAGGGGDTHTGDDARPPDPEPLNAAAVRRRLDGGDAA